jgi:hypothetical protein
MSTLKVGDTVLWRGSWGRNAPVRATVTSLERCQFDEKHGDAVDFMSWLDVPHFAVCDLDNGHWAYGWQLSHLEES